MTVVLESDGRFELAEYPRLAGYCCHGCDTPFVPTATVEVLYDRIGRRCYMIHYKCWDALVDQLEGRI